MSKRIFDRSNYSSETISTFEIFASYVVNIYYNHLYIEAIKMKNSNNAVSSITEGYKHCVLAFMSAIDNRSKTYTQATYNQLLKDINGYFSTWTNCSHLNISDCIDKIVKEFIPIDYFDSLSKDHRRIILRDVINNTIRDFSKTVVCNFLGSIIDNHKDPDNIEALKQGMMDILFMKRETFYTKFLNTAVGKHTEQVDKKIAMNMQQEIKTLTEEKTNLINENKALKSDIRLRISQLKGIIIKYKNLHKSHAMITKQYNTLKESITEPTDYTIRNYSPAPRFVQPIPKPETKPETKPVVQHVPKPEPQHVPKPETKPVMQHSIHFDDDDDDDDINYDDKPLVINAPVQEDIDTPVIVQNNSSITSSDDDDDNADSSTTRDMFYMGEEPRLDDIF